MFEVGHNTRANERKQAKKNLLRKRGLDVSKTPALHEIPQPWFAVGDIVDRGERLEDDKFLDRPVMPEKSPVRGLDVERIIDGVREHSSNMLDYREGKYVARIILAKKLGLTPIGEQSTYADMVAVSEQRPDVVIKVVPKHDGFRKYAELILSGEISSKHAPHIFSITCVGNSYVIIMERLWVKCTRDDCARKECRELVSQLERIHGTCDLHSGNYMRRTDDTMVIIDPWARYR